MASVPRSKRAGAAQISADFPLLVSPLPRFVVYSRQEARDETFAHALGAYLACDLHSFDFVGSLCVFRVLAHARMEDSHVVCRHPFR